MWRIEKRDSFVDREIPNCEMTGQCPGCNLLLMREIPNCIRDDTVHGDEKWGRSGDSAHKIINI